MSGPVEVVLIIGAIGYLLIRRLAGEPAEGRRMLLLPAALTAVGLTDVGKVAQSSASIGFLVATTAVSLAIGVLRGASIRVYEKSGLVFMRYTGVTVALLAANFAIKFGAGLLFGLLDPSAAHASGDGLMLTLGCGLLAEGLAVLSKAVRVGGRILWEKGSHGRPHATSSLLDDLQQKVQDTDWSRTARRGERAGFSSLLDDLRGLDFRRPNNDGPTRGR